MVDLGMANPHAGHGVPLYLYLAGLTYSVGRRILLFGADNSTASCGSVQGTLSTDDSLALRGTRASGLAANLGDVIPVSHREIC